jgi:beta-lactamase class A
VVGQDLDDLLTQAGCTAALHVRRLSDDAEVALRADEAWLAASVIKVAIAVEFYAQAEEGRVDPRTTVTLEPGRRTPGPTGVSLAADPVSMSLRDLCAAMLSISDNAATDAVLARVGVAAVHERLRELGLVDTYLEGGCMQLMDTVANDLGFPEWEQLLAVDREISAHELLGSRTFEIVA